MGIFFHRRAERAVCNASPTDVAPTDVGACVPEDPRQQLTEIRNQRVESNTRRSNLPGQTEIPPAAPAVDVPSARRTDATSNTSGARVSDQNPDVKNRFPQLPALVLTDTPPPAYRRTATNDMTPAPIPNPPDVDVRSVPTVIRSDRVVPPPPVPHPPDVNVTPVPTVIRSDRAVPPPPVPHPPDVNVTPVPTIIRSDRIVPPPPLPDPELNGAPRRDLYQYADGKTQRAARDVPPPPLPNIPGTVVPPRSLPRIPGADVPPPLPRIPGADAAQYPLQNRPGRLVPPPPLPDPELNGAPRRDLYQYGDGRSQRTPREVSPLPFIPNPPERDLPRLPQDQALNFRDHPGPGSIRRRTLQDQLNLPERQGSAPGRTHTTMDGLVPPNALTPRPDDRSYTPADVRQPPPPVPGDGRVTDISAAQLKQLMARTDRPMIVDIWKEHCGGCEAIAPVMNQLAAQYQGQASIYRIHAQEFLRDPELRNQFRFSAVPTTLMFDSGRLLDQHTGAREPNYYAQKLNGAIVHHRQSVSDNANVPYGLNPQRPRERVPDVVDDHVNERRLHRLDARLERIKERISRLTHFSAREREAAFTPTSAEQRTMDLINNERRRHRLPDLVHDPRLQMIANRHTDYQVRHGMTHNENTPGWQNVSQRMQQVGLQGWRENAGSGAFTPETLVSMWMNSPGHRAAILGTGNIGAVCIRNGKATFNLTTDPELQKQV